MNRVASRAKPPANVATTSVCGSRRRSEASASTQETREDHRHEPRHGQERAGRERIGERDQQARERVDEVRQREASRTGDDGHERDADDEEVDEPVVRVRHADAERQLGGVPERGGRRGRPRAASSPARGSARSASEWATPHHPRYASGPRSTAAPRPASATADRASRRCSNAITIERRRQDDPDAAGERCQRARERGTAPAIAARFPERDEREQQEQRFAVRSEEEERGGEDREVDDRPAGDRLRELAGRQVVQDEQRAEERDVGDEQRAPGAGGRPTSHETARTSSG